MLHVTTENHPSGLAWVKSPRQFTRFHKASKVHPLSHPVVSTARGQSAEADSIGADLLKAKPLAHLDLEKFRFLMVFACFCWEKMGDFDGFLGVSY